MQTVAILGCGWLGLPLAKTMIANGMAVKGSTTSAGKLAAFKKDGIEPYLITLRENAVDGDITGFLDCADILIIDIPPKAKSGEDFAGKMRTLIPHIETAGIAHVIFTSSISVYGANQGLVTEDTVPQPETESGRQLLEAEKLLHGNSYFKTTVIRLGGLIGGGRHPVYHLAGGQNLPDPGAPVNLIHRKDCIGIIMAVIRESLWGELFNAVFPHHPTRKEYYTKKALEAGLPVPGFSEENFSAGKVVDAQKIKQGQGYIFRGLI